MQKSAPPPPPPRPDHGGFAAVPKPPVYRWTRPLVRFLEIESASGFVLMGCTVVALVLANSPWAGWYHGLWQTHLNISIGEFKVMPHDTLHAWINDALMTIFFFVVGLEIKRELVAGELSEPRKAALPVMAAAGGMIAPALIYLSHHAGGAAERGWGIPVATDIAFVVGVMALLGPRVPLSLKIMLLSLAIADDIGAVLVIAVAYTEHLELAWLGLGAAGFALCYAFNRIGVRAVSVYTVIGAGIWLGFLHSGIHPTVSGVLLGLMTPASAWVGDRTLREVLSEALQRLGQAADKDPADQPAREGEAPAEPERGGRPPANEDDIRTPRTMGQLALAAREAVSPLERLETALHPWVGFVIMPLFALSNAGVEIRLAALGDPVAIWVAAGLFFGKPIGIVLFSWAAVRLGIAALPRGVNWKVMVGAGCLGGIGFTMSLFIAGLAFAGQPEHLDAAKIGILTGSVCSAILGSTLLLRFLPARPNPPGT